MILKAHANITILVALAILITSSLLSAEEYKHLNTHNSDNIFVYVDFSSCTIAENKLTKSLEGVLLRSRIKAHISKDTPIMFIEGEKGSYIRHNLTLNNKPFLRTFVQCGEYKTTYIYHIDIKFGITDDQGNILYYSYPIHESFGIADIDKINTGFRTHAEDAIADYIYANPKNN